MDKHWGGFNASIIWRKPRGDIMKKYIVTICQEDIYTVTVEADTEEDAKETAMASPDWHYKDTLNFDVMDVQEVEEDDAKILPNVQGEVSEDKDIFPEDEGYQDNRDAEES